MREKDHGRDPIGSGMNFVEALAVAQTGYATWSAKPHNKRWARKIDGTPIPNDLVVCIASAFSDRLSEILGGDEGSD